MRKKLFLAVAFTALYSLQAATINFECLTDNGNDCVSMVSQLSADITDPGSNQILFTFSNVGGIPSTITQIYWDDDDGTLLSIATITNSAGVDFETPATPGDLPAGNTATPAFAADFSVGATPPPATNGIDPG